VLSLVGVVEGRDGGDVGARFLRSGDGENMNRKLVVSTLLAVASSVVVGGIASARSVAAVDGNPEIGAQSNCFNVDNVSGAVLNTCGAAEYIVPTDIDTVGNKSIQFSSRATAVGGLCRAVRNNRLGTAFAASAVLPIPVAAVPVVQATVALPITLPSDVLMLDCSMNAGSRVHALFWTP
jgi:hypothetical protein